MLDGTRQVLSLQSRQPGRLITCRRCWRRGRAIIRLPDRSTSAPRARWTSAGRHAAGAARSNIRPAMSSRRSSGSTGWWRCSRATARRAGCWRPRTGATATPAPTIEALRPLADRPDADSYSLALMGKALEKAGRPGGRGALSRPRRPAATARRSGAAGFAGRRQAVGASCGRRRGAARRCAGADRADRRPAVARRARRGAGARPQASQAAIPARPTPTCWSATRSACEAISPARREEYRKAANLSFTEPVALRMIEALQRSGQTRPAAQVLELFLSQNPQQRPGPVAGRQHLHASSGTGRRRSGSTRGCASGSATATR